jgi:metallo-beta-lactamase family protein
VEVHTPFACGGTTATFRRAGHIIGAASLHLEVDGTSIGFSGDVGRLQDPIMKPPETLAACDYLVVESTYGDRLHPATDVLAALAQVITATLARRGTVVVPSFAVGRSQHVLHLLAELRADGRIPACPIFLDSPMAIDATRIFTEHADDHLLSVEQAAAMGRLATCARTPDDSKAIDRASEPMIVISASGMCTGGRVLHHLQRFLPDERSTILFIGFQAAGTRGRSLIDGASELKLLGQYVPVRARIARIEALSAHADHAELVAWLRASAVAPRQAFVTHGEPAASDAFRRRLHDTFGWAARVPEIGETVSL